jgi:hypothetical protein
MKTERDVRAGRAARGSPAVAWVAAAILAGSIIAAAVGGRAEENLLVPGAEFSQLVLRAGAWCRYVVVDEALGQRDSTEVYIALPASQSTASGRAFWLELATRPLGSPEDEGEVLKLLVLEGITKLSEGDSLGQYVLEFYIKKGDRPPEEKDPRTYEGFSLIVPTAESSWTASDGIAVATRAGRFSCTEKRRSAESNQEIPTGRFKLLRKSRDDYVVWFCEDVPVFRLVKCVIERSRETEMVPRIPGIPVEGHKYSKTTAELTGFGMDAKPRLSVPSSNR